ncbi:MAG: 16S rRNA (guanine(527)-N(7))-methyltransferase RsmG [Pseudomonadota bacterium]
MSFGATDFAAQTNVSRETLERLEIYAALLTKWQKKINLIAPGTVDEMWQRHFYDSAQLAAYIPQKSANLLDLGSGAGFPGLVMACMGCSSVTLIESDLRKTLFLKDVIRETGVKADVINARAETVEVRGDIITARALAPLDKLLSYAVPLLNHGGKCLFLKGETSKDELTTVRQSWQFSVVTHPSQTSDTGSILEISDLKCFT